jgi:hypothetical protein
MYLPMSSCFPSQIYPECKRRRLRRISKAAVPSVMEALGRGEISLRRAEALSRLAPKSQKKELARQLRESLERTQGQLTAAATIERFLANRNGGRLDLEELSLEIQRAICGG